MNITASLRYIFGIIAFRVKIPTRYEILVTKNAQLRRKSLVFLQHLYFLGLQKL